MKKILIFLIAIVFTNNLISQEFTAEQIIEKYIENSGGRTAWDNLNAIKMVGTIVQGDMTIPIELLQLKNGKQYTKFLLFGTEYYQNVFDGNILWSTNFSTQKPEVLDEETTHSFKQNLKDFPDAFLNYKKNGYQIELMEEAIFNGEEAYKIKLTKQAQIINGEKIDDVSFYFFSKATFLALGNETEISEGPSKGTVTVTYTEDYKEVNGLYFPFKLSQGIKNDVLQQIPISTIELNPEVDNSLFEFPTE